MRLASPFPHPRHDHKRCAARALAGAERLCRERAVRLTPLRRQVLAAVWRSHAPIGAYEILATVNTGDRRRMPMAVYRALDFLLAQGLIHRVATRNAFVGCAHPAEAHHNPLLICRICGSAAEIDGKAVRKALAEAARDFVTETQVVEVSGICRHCRANG